MFTQGWHPDPHQRHEFRFFNGQTWTAHVLTGGKTFVDGVQNLHSAGPELPASTLPQGFWPESSAAPVQPYGSPAVPIQPTPIQSTPMQHATYHQQTVFVQARKSVLVAFILTFLFGPLGMLYSTVPGALIMLVISIVLAVFTLGLSLFITWPISIIWGMAACK